MLATRLPDGAQCLLPHPGKPAELNEAAQQALRGRRSGTVKLGDTDWFLQAHNPPLRLIVVGAVHIAQALVPFAGGTVSRLPWWTPAARSPPTSGFPDVTVRTDWPDEAMDGLNPMPAPPW